MSISGIQSSGIDSLRDRFQQFQAGRTNLQKTDLAELKDRLAAKGDPAASGVDSLIQAFDKIDANRDGISADELESFAGSGNSAGGAKSGAAPAKSITINISPLVLDGGAGESAATGTGGSGVQSAGSGAGTPAAQNGEEGKASSGVTMGLLVNIKVQMQNSGQQVPSEISDAISSFGSLDQDQDGKISLDELMSAFGKKDAEAGSDKASVDGVDLKKLLEKAIAALGKNQEAGGAAGTDAKDPAQAPQQTVTDEAAAKPSATDGTAGGAGGAAKKGAARYAAMASMSFEYRESSLSLQYA
ncbi:MAG TPA: EF-hand domain-containing protein [Candidatus Ozemobacteraceae bacterium]